MKLVHPAFCSAGTSAPRLVERSSQRSVSERGAAFHWTRERVGWGVQARRLVLRHECTFPSAPVDPLLQLFFTMLADLLTWFFLSHVV
jgi:hypothetical protein